jgi:hypothetical protein
LLNQRDEQVLGLKLRVMALLGETLRGDERLLRLLR